MRKKLSNCYKLLQFRLLSVTLNMLLVIQLHIEESEVLRLEQKYEERTSNLVNDPELVVRFQKEALRVANSLRYRYFDVFEAMTAEDVVSECWKKILSTDLSYDPSRGAKFETFVRLVVNTKMIDLTKALNRGYVIKNPYSLDYDFQFEDGESTVSSEEYLSTVNSKDDFVPVDVMNELESLINSFNDFPELRDVMGLYIDGYTSKEISKKLGISASKVMKGINAIKRVYYRRQGDDCETLGDLMFGESCDFDKDKESYVINILSLMRDPFTKIKLSQLFKGVIDGMTYKGLSKKLKVSEDVLDGVIRRWESFVL